MLVSSIDRNKEPDPEKHIGRINSAYWTLPSNGGLGSSKTTKVSHPSEGIILRVRDTRLMERRQNLSTYFGRERRVRDNRKHDPRLNTTTHHILVIALERKAGDPEPWQSGDRVSVVPKSRVPAPSDTPHPPADVRESKPPLLNKDEGDYVLHISKPYPYER